MSLGRSGALVVPTINPWGCLPEGGPTGPPTVPVGDLQSSNAGRTGAREETITTMDPNDVPRRAEPSPVAAPTSSAADLTGAVRVTDLLGHQVLGVGGARLGRLEGLTILHGDARPEVHRILLRDAGERRALDGDLVELVDGPSFTTRRTPGDLEVRRDADVASTELRLGADVLDRQVVDLTDHHLVCVGDVLIADIDGRILVVRVEVDLGAVLRRLGLRRLARRVPTRVVPWDELHLASRRGHEVQLESRSAHLDRCSALDLAHLLARLRVEHADDGLHHRVRRRAGDPAACLGTGGVAPARGRASREFSQAGRGQPGRERSNGVSLSSSAIRWLIVTDAFDVSGLPMATVDHTTMVIDGSRCCAVKPM